MKSKCPNPIILKNGTVVPCGKCEICRTDARTEWQYRLRIHLMSCDKMPMFVTLTYDDYHLPFVGKSVPDVVHMVEKQRYCFSAADIDECPEISSWFRAVEPTVYRPDASAFIKAYKRKYELSQDEFAYFGCSEYGDTFGRPHMHFIFFGDSELYNLFMADSELAKQRIVDVWDKGHVHVCVAGYDGMAYVTKYVLKSNKDDYHGLKYPPFTIASNGLGMNYLKTISAREDMSKLHELKYNFLEIVENMPELDFYSKSSIRACLDYLEPYMPKFQCVLDDGVKIFVPRAIRKKMVGSFEHFKDNPLWLYRSLQNLIDSIEYYEVCGDYDASHKVSSSYERSMMSIDKINQNKNIAVYNKNLKRLKLYESIRQSAGKSAG